MRRRSRLLAGFLLTVSVGCSADGSPADSLINLLNEIETLQAAFSQYAAHGSNNLQKGEFWLARPNKFRVESGPPLSQTIVSDGTNLWTHDRDLEQVIISPLDVSADEIPILLFAGDPEQVTRQFAIEAFEDEHSRHFVLVPQGDDAVLKTIAIRFDERTPVAISIENAMSERTRIDLSDVVIDGTLAPDTFEFAMPESVDVLDDRPLQ